MEQLTAISLFAGIGGFDLAMNRAGIKTVATVEIDRSAQGVLKKQFPECTHFDDVRNVTPNELLATGFDPRNGIITGGFPCQDLSIAGRREGLVGSRSGLFWEIIRLVESLKPKFVVLENVPGLLSSNNGRDMATVIRSLVQCGYGVGYRVLDSQYFGVAQRRRRVFIVGCFGDNGTTPSKILAITESLFGNTKQGKPKGKDASTDVGKGSPVLLTMREGKTGGGQRPFD